MVKNYESAGLMNARSRSFFCGIDERTHDWRDHPLQCQRCGDYICEQCFTAVLFHTGIMHCVICQGIYVRLGSSPPPRIALVTGR